MITICLGQRLLEPFSSKLGSQTHSLAWMSGSCYWRSFKSGSSPPRMMPMWQDRAFIQLPGLHPLILSWQGITACFSPFVLQQDSPCMRGTSSARTRMSWLLWNLLESRKHHPSLIMEHTCWLIKWKSLHYSEPSKQNFKKITLK